MTSTHNKKYLSYSGYSTYVTCPKKYDYHYNQKLRSTSEPFHLIFGSAVDKAVNVLLEQAEDLELAIDVAKEELKRLFSGHVTFLEKDFDADLFTSRTHEELILKLRSCDWKGENPSALCAYLWNEIEIGTALKENQMKSLKYLLYFCSVEKISLMLTAFIEYVVPQIENIYAVQKNVKRGIFDFEADFKGVGRVIADIKTSTSPYESDAVKLSVQLAGYGAVKGMYIVFNKNINKNRTKECSICKKNGTGQRHTTCNAEINKMRCNGAWIETISPECVPQFIIDNVPERNREIVEEAYQEVEKAIESGCFPRNLTNCQKQYGRPCEYINLCWQNKMDGLVVKNDKDKEIKN